MLNVDGTMLSTALVSLGTAIGGFAGGRATGRGTASQVAVDTVEMLETQINLLKEERNSQDTQLMELRHRVEILEGLVTQRAEVEELNIKVSLVKDTVDRIAVKVGA